MILIENYKKCLQAMKLDKHNQIKSFAELHCDDDVTLSRIELNIIDIFEQMFNASEKKALSGNAPLQTLHDTFLGYFDKIPSNWHLQLEQCQKFGDEEGAFKENLKINQANSLKKTFIKMYEEVNHETK